jgi:predicted kinase
MGVAELHPATARPSASLTARPAAVQVKAVGERTGVKGKRITPLTPEQAQEVREARKAIREAEADAAKAWRKLTMLAQKYGARAVAKEAKVSRQALEKRIGKVK